MITALRAVVAWSNLWVRSSSLPCIPGLNPAWGNGCIPSVFVVQVGNSAKNRSLVQRSPTECVFVSLSVISGTITRYTYSD
jgi:hypothetical protein